MVPAFPSRIGRSRSSCAPRTPAVALLAMIGAIVPVACGGSEQGPTEPQDFNKTGACVARAVFGAPGESDYVLPYPVGQEHFLRQSYCFAGGGHSNQLAYDFSLPIGAPVVASRAGAVVRVEDSFEDTGLDASRLNSIHIQHVDGTVAFYAHLRQHASRVSLGDVVTVGQQIASSGNSGATLAPHLHFAVFRSWPPREGADLAVNFRNAEGRLDSRDGLLEGVRYLALPFTPRVP